MEFDRFLRSDPGHPLGVGAPTGRPFADGGSHRARWIDLIRRDPCAYCGREAGTLDHIVPRSQQDRTTHTWLNYTAACGGCNQSKGDRPLLLFLAGRVGVNVPKPRPVHGARRNRHNRRRAARSSSSSSERAAPLRGFTCWRRTCDTCGSGSPSRRHVC